MLEFEVDLHDVNRSYYGDSRGRDSYSGDDRGRSYGGDQRRDDYSRGRYDDRGRGGGDYDRRDDSRKRSSDYAIDDRPNKYPGKSIQAILIVMIQLCCSAR